MKKQEEKSRKQKKLQNPTKYFYEQIQKIPKDINIQIQNFVNTLLNKNTCQLCKNDYDVINHIPRILIHCGHTFCSPCLELFFMQRRVRCPMCLKLVKKLDSLQRLPINHTIFTHLVQKNKKQSEQQNKNPLIKNAQKYLFSEFEKIQKQAHKLQNPPRSDPQTGLPFCVFHTDRIQHYYCQYHKNSGCRPCIQIGHTKPQCQIIDLLTVQDLQRYQQIMQQSHDISQRFIPHAKINRQQGIFQFGSMIDPSLMEDDDDDYYQDEEDQDEENESNQLNQKK